jgi:hypothetical protein
VLIKTDFHRVVQVAYTPSGDRDHTSIGWEAADIKRKYPAQNIDFADNRIQACLPAIPLTSINQN